MPTKYTREGYRERADSSGKLRHRLFKAGRQPMRMTTLHWRIILILGVFVMFLLLVGGQLLGPSLGISLRRVEEGTGTIFAKESYDVDKPDAEYLLGLRMSVEGGKVFEDVVDVEPAFWKRVKEGDTVNVRYTVDKETGAVQVKMVLLPKGED